MKINIPVSNDLSLTIANKPDEGTAYPTSHLQKGLLLGFRGLDLAEEAVGFGIPVLKRGFQTLFTGNVELGLIRNDSTWVVTALYTIDLMEKLARQGRPGLDNKLLYAVKNSMAAFIRRFPHVREFLTALSGGLRGLFGWETTYEKAAFSTQVRMTYTFDEQTKQLTIEADLAGLPQDGVTEVVIMNEQGAHYFEEYRDSSGTNLSGKEIGCWDEVTGEEAAFICSTHRVAFSLQKVVGARLFRGRELVGSRLAWAGFGYSFPPTTSRFGYIVRIEKLT